MIRKTSKILLVVTPEIKERLNRISQENGLSMSEVIRRGIINELRSLE
jgi:predicted DNA-binding protein